MATFLLESAVRLAAPREEVFPFFSDAANLELLTPPWLSFDVVTERPIAMRVGTEIDYRLALHGIPVRWRSVISVWEPPVRFVDEQLRGPYRLWHHEHRFSDGGDGTTLAEDRVRFAVPFGRIVVPLLVRRDLEKIFAYRLEEMARRFGLAEDGAGGVSAPHLAIRRAP